MSVLLISPAVCSNIVCFESLDNILSSICCHVIVLGAVRVGMIGKELIVNPCRDQVINNSGIIYVYTCTRARTHKQTHKHTDCSVRIYSCILTILGSYAGG